MKKKLRSFVILTALSTATIHIINRGIHYFATMHNLLQRDDTDDYEWRFGRVHYRKCGEGKPLLLLHDLAPASSSVEWSYTISLLAKNHTVYAIDLLGCGQSDKPNLTYTNFLYVQMISDFIKNVVHKQVDVIATGSSAPLVAMVSTGNQELIDKMVFVNPQDLYDLAKIPSKRSKLLYHLISMPLLGTFLYNILFCKKQIVSNAEKLFYDQTQIDEWMINAYHEAAHIDNMHSRYLFASIKGNYTKVNLVPFLPNITHSIFVIRGINNPLLENNARQYQKYLPSIEVIEIDETTYLPQIEKPEEFCEQVEIITKSAKERNLRIKSIANYFSKLVFSFLILKSGNVSHETFTLIRRGRPGRLPMSWRNMPNGRARWGSSFRILSARVLTWIRLFI